MAILYGTQSNGETLPVLVDQFGNLLAKGIEGPPGPEGPPGVGELPPGAFDGAVLGWENGELVWFGSPLPPVVDYSFRPVIYTGNGGTQSITSVGFSPDLVWIKDRDNDFNHQLYDTIRGTNSCLHSNSTNEAADYGAFTSFDPDGFTVPGTAGTNLSGSNQVAWCWDAGDTTIINNDGSIRSEVRSNGNFSIVTWNGNGTDNQSVGHNLNSIPGLAIFKRLTGGNSNWQVWHKSLGNTQRVILNTTGPATAAGTQWGAGMTAAVLGIGNSSGVNTSGSDYVAYAWAKTDGVTKFSQYAGSSARQTIQIGFKPSLVIIKSTGTSEWLMFDNARGDSNALYPNFATTEEDTGVMEFMDDGFQLLYALPGVNVSGETYIYAAFANPEDAAFARRQLRRQVRQEERQQNETPLR